MPLTEHTTLCRCFAPKRESARRALARHNLACGVSHRSWKMFLPACLARPHDCESSKYWRQALKISDLKAHHDRGGIAKQVLGVPRFGLKPEYWL